MENQKEKEFVSVSEYAELKKISRQAVQQQIKTGKVKAEKIGRAYIINLNQQ
jgi:predicted DNA-binding protein YlxM (UPF0122 family)